MFGAAPAAATSCAPITAAASIFSFPIIVNRTAAMRSSALAASRAVGFQRRLTPEPKLRTSEEWVANGPPVDRSNAGAGGFFL